MTGKEFLDNIVSRHHVLDECEKTDLLGIIGEHDITYMENPPKYGFNICLKPEGPDTSRRVCICSWREESGYSPYTGRQVGDGIVERRGYFFMYTGRCPCCGQSTKEMHSKTNRTRENE